MTDVIVPNATDGKAFPSFEWDFCCDLEVDFGSEENASMVHAALAVDRELQPDKVKRQMSLSGGKLSVHFDAVEARFLRASFSSFVDILTLATKTIEEFGPRQDESGCFYSSTRGELICYENIKHKVTAIFASEEDVRTTFMVEAASVFATTL